MAVTTPQGKTQTALSDINVTPFVDVLLVLLVIFMLTAPILQSGIELDVPKTRTVREISRERLVVSIDRGQRLFLGSDPVNIHMLGPLLREKGAQEEVSRCGPLLVRRPQAARSENPSGVPCSFPQRDTAACWRRVCCGPLW